MDKNSFPKNVRSFDWTADPMSGPPSKRTHVGYQRFADLIWVTEDSQAIVNRNVDYYVLPDGSAEKVCVREEADLIPAEEKAIVDIAELQEEKRVERFQPGEWEVEYPSPPDYGSQGGVFIRPKK